MSFLEKKMAEAVALASRGGHRLTPWERASGTGVLGYEAVCMKCGQTIYASSLTINSLLDEVCPAKKRADVPAESVSDSTQAG